MTDPVEACDDVERLERLRTGESEVEVEFFDGDGGDLGPRLRIYQASQPYLTDLLPVLDNFGLKVVDATLTAVKRAQLFSLRWNG